MHSPFFIDERGDFPPFTNCAIILGILVHDVPHHMHFVLVGFDTDINVLCCFFVVVLT